MPRCFVSFVSRLKQSKTQQVDGIITIYRQLYTYILYVLYTATVKYKQPNVNNTNQSRDAGTERKYQHLRPISDLPRISNIIV